ncbi:zinc-binding dehydrogenase [Nocardia vaccinii]|uniref:zinc-binding dehydrogenase n=1 Tax=Nocardia vaccinii TaxID=1822 RepID=UPI000A41E6CC|nr:zinc-binding dehydrogenase [Nocardia vaccinii]
MSIPATMRALQQTSRNGPRDMRLITDAPVPNPGPGEVLIRVTAAGVNFADISKSHGTFGDGPQPPYLAGFEAAGEVVAVGDAVTSPRPGARVVGVGVGAFADYMVLPAAAAVPVPPGWTEQQALGLMVNWPTALAALKPLGGITAGQTVLIQAAAGATGQAAIAIAKHYGATVVATASPAKHETVLALGADHVLDSLHGDLAAEVLRLTGGAGVDVALESAGGATFEASLAAAKRITGRVVVYGSAGGEAAITNWDLVYRHQVHLIGLNIGVLIQAAPQIFGEVMGELSTLIAAGVLAPVQPTAYDLAYRGVRALRRGPARTGAARRRHPGGDAVRRLAVGPGDVYPHTRCVRAGHARRLADDRDHRQWTAGRRRVPPGRGRYAASRRSRGAGTHRHRRLPRDQVPRSGAGHNVRLPGRARALTYRHGPA